MVQRSDGAVSYAGSAEMTVRHAHAIGLLALVGLGLGCESAQSARSSRCEFGEFPIPSAEDVGGPAALWRPRTVETISSQRSEFHRKNVVVSGYYHRAYEESHLWPSKVAAAERRLVTPRIRVSEVGEA